MLPNGHEREFPDGSSGFKAEAGRYHLYVAHGCPWAHRTLIYRSIKKLKGAITVAYAIPGLKQQGWMSMTIRPSQTAPPIPQTAFAICISLYRDRSAPVAGGRHVELARIGFGVGDEFGNGLGRDGYPPGGSADITARLLGQWLSERAMPRSSSIAP